MYIDGTSKINTASLSDSVNLEKLWIKDSNGIEPVDLAFLSKTDKLKELRLEKVSVKNFDSFAGSVSLETLDATKADGIVSLP